MLKSKCEFILNRIAAPLQPLLVSTCMYIFYSETVDIINGDLERWPRVFVHFLSCSIQLNMKYQLLINTKMLEKNDFFLFQTQMMYTNVFIMVINFKMPTIIDILTFMNMEMV